MKWRAIFWITICCILILVFAVRRGTYTSARHSEWYIRVNAIRDLQSKSKSSGHAVIGENRDLVVWGKASVQAIDQLILSLEVEKNIVINQKGFVVPDYWMENVTDKNVPASFAKGSILVEDVVRFNPDFFIVLLHSSESGQYLIMINNAKKILSSI